MSETKQSCARCKDVPLAGVMYLHKFHGLLCTPCFAEVRRVELQRYNSPMLDSCPECNGGRLMREGKCCSCVECGWSKCAN